MRHQIAKVAVLLAMAAAFGTSVASAAFVGLPSTLADQLPQVRLARPVLPPIGHSQFCLNYPADCEVQDIDLNGGDVTLTPQRWNELNTVNREVNRDIVAEVTPGNDTTDEWLISPPAGDCKDYAITKRHELLARGWPSRALLLAEVIVPSGEHHLILIARVKNLDLVLDNLNENIRQAATTFRRYQWVRMELPQNPKYWMAVSVPNTTDIADASD